MEFVQTLITFQYCWVYAIEGIHYRSPTGSICMVLIM